jgi:hypothetical protein
MEEQLRGGEGVRVRADSDSGRIPPAQQHHRGDRRRGGSDGLSAPSEDPSALRLQSHHAGYMVRHCSGKVSLPRDHGDAQDCE